MLELILALWVASAVLLFLPVGSASRLIRRRLLPANAASGEMPPQSAPSSTSTTDGPPGGGGQTAAAAEPGDEAAVGLAVATKVEPSAEEVPATSEEGPATGRVGAAARALELLRGMAGLALYAVFIAGAIYLVPRLLARVLDTEHPMAAVTSQSMYPALKRGDLVFIEGVDRAVDLKVGQIIAFETGNGFGIHRIVRVTGETITTKGDANFAEDESIDFDQVIGRALTVRGRLAKIPYLGNLPLFFRATSDGNVGEAEPPPVYEGGVGADGGA